MSGVGVTMLIVTGAAAAAAGLLIGALAGAWFADRRLRRMWTGVGDEIVRMRAVAEDTLLGDDPELPNLLRDFNLAADKTFRAIEALQDQIALTRRKSEGGREVVASSRHIVRMMEEMGVAVAYAEPPQTARLEPAPVADERQRDAN
mgnify:CR=1 FL=1